MEDKTNESEKSFQSCNEGESEKSYTSCSKIAQQKDEDDDDIRIGSCRENASDEEVSSWDEDDDNNQWIYENEHLEQVAKCPEKTVSEDALKDLDSIMETKINLNEKPRRKHIPKKKINDPTVIPTDGKYFMHDDRDKEDKAKDNSKKFKNDIRNKKVDNKWSHDLFEEIQQKPLTNHEIIDKYGYNIRDKNIENEIIEEKFNYKPRTNRRRRDRPLKKITNEYEDVSPRKDRPLKKITNEYEESPAKLLNKGKYDKGFLKTHHNDIKIDVSEIPKRPENRKSDFENIKITVDPSNQRLIETNKPKFNNRGNYKGSSYRDQPEWDVTPGVGDVIEEMPPLSEEEIKRLGTGKFGPEPDVKDFKWSSSKVARNYSTKYVEEENWGNNRRGRYNKRYDRYHDNNNWYNEGYDEYNYNPRDWDGYYYEEYPRNDRNKGNYRYYEEEYYDEPRWYNKYQSNYDDKNYYNEHKSRPVNKRGGNNNYNTHNNNNNERKFKSEEREYRNSNFKAKTSKSEKGYTASNNEPSNQPKRSTNISSNNPNTNPPKRYSQMHNQEEKISTAELTNQITRNSQNIDPTIPIITGPPPPASTNYAPIDYFPNQPTPAGLFINPNAIYYTPNTNHHDPNNPIYYYYPQTHPVAITSSNNNPQNIKQTGNNNANNRPVLGKHNHHI